MSRPYWNKGTRYQCSKCKNSWGGARWHVRGSKIGEAHFSFKLGAKSGAESTNYHAVEEEK